MQLEKMNKMMITYNELNGNDIEITTLKLQNEQLRNYLKRGKKIVEIFNRPSEAIKYFEQLMRSPGSNSDTTGFSYNNIEEG